MVTSVEDTVVVHVAVSAPRRSSTVTGPICPVKDVPAAPLPRFTEAGTVTFSAPAVTVNVTVVSPVVAASADCGTASARTAVASTMAMPKDR